jgi:hypothetical protein
MKIHPVRVKLTHADKWTDRQDKAQRHSAQVGQCAQKMKLHWINFPVPYSYRMVFLKFKLATGSA